MRGCIEFVIASRRCFAATGLWMRVQNRVLRRENLKGSNEPLMRRELPGKRDYRHMWTRLEFE
jgi:hypothetical protein